MENEKEIFHSHQKLSNCSVNFLKFAKKNSECCKRINFKSLLSNKSFSYFRSQPWPTFINIKTKKRMEEVALKMYRLITSIPDRFFNYDAKQMSSYYEIPDYLLQLLIYGANNEFIQSIFGRGDFVFATSGELKCIEFNMQANLGGWELDILESLYTNIPVISEFLSEHHIQISPNCFFYTLMNHVIENFFKIQTQSKENEINMAIAFPQDIGFSDSTNSEYIKKFYKTILQKKQQTLEGEAFFCPVADITAVNDSLFYGHKKIHILIEICNGVLPFPFLVAMKAGNLMIYNGPITRIMSNKLNLAILSENINSGLFTLAERQFIETHVPWTRKLKTGETTYKNDKIRLEEFIISNREQLVIKPAEGLGGNDVYPGNRTSPDLWNQKVNQALVDKNWVVQEFVPSLPFLYQSGDIGCSAHHAIWGLFTLGNRYAGGFVRILPAKHNTGVINSSKGAEESIILEVEE